MAVKYAILGLLIKEPSYPYELSATFKQQTGNAWELNRGQVYQTVYRLEDEGLLERISREPNAHGIKWIYRATKLGKREYERWLLSSREKVRPLRDDTLLKIAMAKPEDVNHLLRMIERQERLCAQRLQEYSEFEATLVPFEEACDWEDVGPSLITNAAMAQLNLEMRWLAEARNVLVRLKDEDRKLRKKTPELKQYEQAAQLNG